MKKKFNLTAILAVVMVAMLSINLVSCTADDEYGDFAFGTLAEELITPPEMTIPPSHEILEGGDTTITKQVLVMTQSQDFCVDARFRWIQGIYSTTRASVTISKGENDTQRMCLDSDGNSISVFEYEIMSIEPENRTISHHNEKYTIENVKVEYRHNIIKEDRVVGSETKTVDMIFECPIGHKKIVQPDRS